MFAPLGDTHECREVQTGVSSVEGGTYGMKFGVQVLPVPQSMSKNSK
jgi:hypothetical protein